MRQRKPTTLKLDKSPLQVHKTVGLIELINKARKVTSDPVIRDLGWGWPAKLLLASLPYYIAAQDLERIQEKLKKATVSNGTH